jgi:hypothetical protein
MAQAITFRAFGAEADKAVQIGRLEDWKAAIAEVELESKEH